MAITMDWSRVTLASAIAFLLGWVLVGLLGAVLITLVVLVFMGILRDSKSSLTLSLSGITLGSVIIFLVAWLLFGRMWAVIIAVLTLVMMMWLYHEGGNGMAKKLKGCVIKSTSEDTIVIDCPTKKRANDLADSLNAYFGQQNYGWEADKFSSLRGQIVLTPIKRKYGIIAALVRDFGVRGQYA